ncbi:MAG: hypothetical protein M1823_004876 [Watsoniomyces obsoletus]|nr:MAG: hypothetical protein M1823_004876 [Watsoniomyces obsoletus]
MARQAVIVAILACVPLALGARFCPPLGAVLPHPRNLSTNSVVREAAANLSSALDDATQGRNPDVPYQANVTSSSVSVRSIYDSDFILRHHHTAPVRNDSLGGTTNVTSDTLYRIGSITKVFTVLALLLQEGKVSYDDPVTKYIPELAALASKKDSEGTRDVDRVRWNDVTLRALAAHLSGIGRDYLLEFASSSTETPTIPGLPPLNATDLPTCGRPGTSPCSAQEYLAGFSRRHPVFPTSSTPSYSNVAFTLLGLVVEKVTKKPYATVIEEQIFKPLGMSRSSVTPPKDPSGSIIPAGPDAWSTNFEIDNPDGSIYSSTNDLSAFGRAILRNELLDPATTRAWLKPLTHTSSLSSSVGAPWEIYRVRGVTPDDRLIDLYTKSGGVGSYATILTLVPDYGLVITILTAGAARLDKLAELVIKHMFPAVDQAARDQAQAQYAGVYTSTAADNSTVSFAVDDGPGLNVERWIVNGVDYVELLGSMPGQTPLVGAGPTQPSIRLYPTGLVSNGNGTSGSKVSFRALVEQIPAGNTTATKESALFDICLTWFGFDGLLHGSVALDEVVFELGPTGRTESVDLRGWRQVLTKSS